MSDIAGRLASALQLPDADVQLGMSLLAAITGWSKQRTGGPPGAPPAAGAAGAPPGLSMPGGPAGGGSPNQTQPNLAAPAMRQGGGLTQGLSPNPDEMRRVMQQATAGG